MHACKYTVVHLFRCAPIATLCPLVRLLQVLAHTLYKSNVFAAGLHLALRPFPKHVVRPGAKSLGIAPFPRDVGKVDASFSARATIHHRVVRGPFPMKHDRLCIGVCGRYGIVKALHGAVGVVIIPSSTVPTLF